MDDRFSHVLTDPRFRTLRKSDKKIKIDKRFEKMLTEKQFKLKYSVDKRGKEIEDNAEEYKKLYHFSKEEKCSDSEEISKSDHQMQTLEPLIERPKIPDARGVESDENSSDSSSSDSDESVDENEELDHNWSEWDRNVAQTETVSKRLAVCNMDWDRINATDLFVLFNSFKHSSGSIISVKIYPSKLGSERLKAEEVSGPVQFITGENPKNNSKQESDNVHDSDENDEEDGHKSHKSREQVRRYQLSRLNYFYAVVECDSETTANALYTELDGLEYESSASTLDLRFIPHDMTFEDDVLEPKSECNSIPNYTTYKAPQFVNSALQQSKVVLTWDETDPKRKHLFENAFNKETDDDLRAYLASSDEEEYDSEEVDNFNEQIKQMKGKDRINKYKQLLNSINENVEKNDEDMEMEITWEPNLKDVAEDMVNKRERDKDVSVFEDNYNKKKEKRKNAEIVDSEEDISKDDIIEKNVKNNRKKSFKSKKKIIDIPEDANLQLLLMDESEDDKKHFNYKNIVEEEADNSKKRKNKTEQNDSKDDFKFDAEDPRFKSLYTSHHYNVDQSDPHFKKTDAFNKIISQTTHKSKFKDIKNAKQDNDCNNTDGNTLSQLVRRVKHKAQHSNKNRKHQNFYTNKFKS